MAPTAFSEIRSLPKAYKIWGSYPHQSSDEARGQKQPDGAEHVRAQQDATADGGQGAN